MSRERWILGLMICSLIIQIAVAAPPAVHPKTGEPLMIDCLRGTPTAIDGDLSDWNLAALTPAVLDVQEQIYTGLASWTGPEDCSATFYVLWDDEKVYLAAIIKDDTLSMNKTGADIWNADCVEFFFSTLDYVPTDDHTGHYQWGFNANEQKWEWEVLENWTGNECDYLEMASVRTADGYICEAAIEHGSITSFEFVPGNTIGFHPCVDDTDAADREIQMTWTGREAHDQSQGFGHMFLSPELAVSPELSKKPRPDNGEIDILRDTDLSWTAGDYAVSHDVYFGTVFDDVNGATRDNPMDVLVSQGQTGTTYSPVALLDYGTTYYWRVDEVNGAPDRTIHRGSVWNFTTEPLAYAIEGIVATSNTTSEADQGPEKLVDGSGLNDQDQHSTRTNDMWAGTPTDEAPYVQFEFDNVYKLHEMLVWNYNFEFEMFLGFSVKEATVEYSIDGTDWTTLGDVELARGPGASGYTYNSTVAFDGIAARYVRLMIHSSWNASAPSHGLSEVRFMAIPVQARKPLPVDGAANIPLDTLLSWRSGRQAETHEVHLGTDPATLAMVGTTTQASYGPSDLDLDTTYYWQVVEVNEAEAISTWPGDIWSFTTQEYIEVDGFEAYDDDIEAGTTIWQAWVDGIDEPSNGGGVVGYGQSPFAEQTIVHTGRQSMPFSFENDSASAISETDRTFAPAQDWTANGIQVLSLWFYGTDGNTGQLYATINGTKVLYDGDAGNIALPQWQSWNIDLTTIGVNVGNVSTLSLGIQGVGSGQLYIDDVRLYAEAP